MLAPCQSCEKTCGDPFPWVQGNCDRRYESYDLVRVQELVPCGSARVLGELMIQQPVEPDPFRGVRFQTRPDPDAYSLRRTSGHF